MHLVYVTKEYQQYERNRETYYFTDYILNIPKELIALELFQRSDFSLLEEEESLWDKIPFEYYHSKQIAEIPLSLKTLDLFFMKPVRDQLPITEKVLQKIRK